MTLTLIGLFAILGAWARYGQSLLMQKMLGRAFPWATLSINVLGSFLMGFLFFLTVHGMPLDAQWRVGILTGGLGAYTTFSTFSLESLMLLEEGEAIKAFMYMLSSLVLCVGGVFFGTLIAQLVGGLV